MSAVAGIFFFFLGWEVGPFNVGLVVCIGKNYIYSHRFINVSVLRTKNMKCIEI